VALPGSPLKSTPSVDTAELTSRPAAPIRVALAMASDLDRMAWSIVIGNQEDMELMAAPGSSQQLLKALEAHALDVILVDEAILEQCDPKSLPVFRKQPASLRVILVAMHRPDYALEATRFPFVHARLLKGVSAPELLETIRARA
jgi:DNA-binding NarL/FixJ family response regulator